MSLQGSNSQYVVARRDLALSDEAIPHHRRLLRLKTRAPRSDMFIMRITGWGEGAFPGDAILNDTEIASGEVQEHPPRNDIMRDI